jgi:opacity protein-like surface antigen
MKKIKILIPVFALLICVNIFSQPKMVIHVTGGYTLPAADFGGTYSEPFIPEHYYMKPGPNLGADVKYLINKQRTLGLLAAGSYNIFQTDDLGGLSNEFGDMYSYKYKLNVLSISLGMEYRFLTAAKFKPFINAELAGYIYNGTATPSLSSFSVINIKSTRFGFALGTGVDWNLTKNFGFVLGAKYNFANLIGKKDSTESTTAYQTGLVDKEFTKYNITFPSRQIQYLQFYAGVSFFLLQSKK